MLEFTDLLVIQVLFPMFYKAVQLKISDLDFGGNWQLTTAILGAIRQRYKYVRYSKGFDILLWGFGIKIPNGLKHFYLAGMNTEFISL